ncbi:class I SAM-dependent methyltransferase [Thiocystis violacea]|uniref:class I SAM-dependent methyltransferase n=1 Tax=Thiocystis violacea TaxID=13725 RepID=UPI001904CF41|nr:methyltransferase domain-containing protein [Thiocystis violacea]MBK1724683.1 hypothetical protein [Thiocystis violacea]
MKKYYPQEFYSERHEKTIYSANTVISILIDLVPNIDSAIDVGCGIGTWLSVLQEKGIKEVQGVDGDWVDQDLLVIPKPCFMQTDLKKPLKLSKRYDLAICLEVAEHLPSDNANNFVGNLTELSDFVLFSAAIPYQGGDNHINEQWPSYWVKLFDEKGYDVYDFIRQKIWEDEKISVWYKQNILFFAKRDKLNDLRSHPGITALMPLNVVHPQLYKIRASNQAATKEQNIGVLQNAKNLLNSLSIYTKKVLKLND